MNKFQDFLFWFSVLVLFGLIVFNGFIVESEVVAAVVTTTVVVSIFILHFAAAAFVDTTGVM